MLTKGAVGVGPDADSEVGSMMRSICGRGVSRISAGSGCPVSGGGSNKNASSGGGVGVELGGRQYPPVEQVMLVNAKNIAITRIRRLGSSPRNLALNNIFRPDTIPGFNSLSLPFQEPIILNSRPPRDPAIQHERQGLVSRDPLSIITPGKMHMCSR